MPRNESSLSPRTRPATFIFVSSYASVDRLSFFSLSLSLSLSRVRASPGVCYSFAGSFPWLFSRFCPCRLGRASAVESNERKRRGVPPPPSPSLLPSRPANPPGHYLKRSRSEATKCHRYLSLSLSLSLSVVLYTLASASSRRRPASAVPFYLGTPSEIARFLSSVSLLLRHQGAREVQSHRDICLFPETKRRARMIARMKTEGARLL